MKQNTKINLLKILCALFVISMLQGCSDVRCVDADDFGFPEYRVPAKYKSEDISGEKEDQVIPWLDTELFLKSSVPLIVVVNNWSSKTYSNDEKELSAWCPWYGEDVHDTNKLASLVYRLRVCKFENDQMCTDTVYAKIQNAPCVFTKGVGLYGLVTKRGYDPNTNKESKRYPSKDHSDNFHMGDPENPGNFYDIDKEGSHVQAGGIRYNYDEQNKGSFDDGKLYFKILDKHYEDNSGQYIVKIKSGYKDPSTDFLDEFSKHIIEVILGKENGLVKKIYEKVVKNNAYKNMVRAALIIYVMLFGWGFLIGIVRISSFELMIRMFKIMVISMLISDASWEFFYNNLFSLFITGGQYVKHLIQNASSVGPGSGSIIALMLSPKTMYKLMSLLFVDWRGFIFIILYILLLYWLLMIFFHAYSLYVTSMVTVGLIIIMAPIFFCFMLFGITRSLFDNWLKQLAAYSIQPIILFMGITFISVMIKNQIYNTLGFPVCRYDFPNLGFDFKVENIVSPEEGYDKNSTSLFSWWFPVIKSTNKVEIPVPREVKVDLSTNKPIKSSAPIDNQNLRHYSPYEYEQERYIDLPFFDPDDEYDRKRIDDFRSGHFVHFYDLLILFIGIYFLSRFNTLAVSIAKFIGNIQYNQSDVSGVAQSVAQKFHEKAGYIKQVNDGGPNRNIFRRGLDKVNRGMGFATNKLVDRLVKSNKIEKEVMNKDKINKGVTDEIKSKHDIDYDKLNLNAKADYRDGIYQFLKKEGMGESVSQKMKGGRKGLAEELSKLSKDDLKDRLAELKFGKQKEYKNLKKLQTIDKVGYRDLARSDREFIDNTLSKKEKVSTRSGLSDTIKEIFKEDSKQIDVTKESNRMFFDSKGIAKHKDDGTMYFKQEIARLKFDKGYSDLSHDQKSLIDGAFGRSVKTSSLSDLGSDHRDLKKFSEIYERYKK